MIERLVEKVDETSEKEVLNVNKSRRNFFKYISKAGVVGIGLLGGYLCHKTFGELSLREKLNRIPKSNYDKRLEIIMECINKNPSEVKKYMFATKPGLKGMYNNFNFNYLNEEDIIKVKLAYKQIKDGRYEIDLPNDPVNLSESNKLFIFLCDELTSKEFFFATKIF